MNLKALAIFCALFGLCAISINTQAQSPSPQESPTQGTPQPSVGAQLEKCLFEFDSLPEAEKQICLGLFKIVSGFLPQQPKTFCNGETIKDEGGCHKFGYSDKCTECCKALSLYPQLCQVGCELQKPTSSP